jgi:hypothetical protein
LTDIHPETASNKNSPSSSAVRGAMTGCVFELLAMLYEKELGKRFDVAIFRIYPINGKGI